MSQHFWNSVFFTAYTFVGHIRSVKKKKNAAAIICKLNFCEHLNIKLLQTKVN